MKLTIPNYWKTIFWLIVAGAVVLMIPKAWYLAFCWVMMSIYSAF